ncbi:DUF1905 domain-containing protein [Parerythrobacter aestuarii]|uniref:DUF1905 domain-containing protein n=1 Tax=Parerythrobacter aestuarii TaxID=3020909 RepID=UPI0024DEED84|nr:DUF1905 domain-containing protein [Parerythrobacter aestuarii]
MSNSLVLTTSLVRWDGGTAAYHLVRIDGEPAEAIAMHARIERLETGRRRGFGSVKVSARVGDTEWKSSVFPSKPNGWILLVSKKVMRAEDLAEGDPVRLELELL